MNDQELIEEQIDSAIEIFFQRWRVQLFGNRRWTDEVKLAKLKTELREFLTKSYESRID